MDHAESRAFSRDETRNNVIPTYLGLIAEIDHHVGRLMAFLEEQGTGRQHGGRLHIRPRGIIWAITGWARKDLYHEEIVKVPLIIADPRPARRRRPRGRVVHAFAEAIDLAPTFVEIGRGRAREATGWKGAP